MKRNFLIVAGDARVRDRLAGELRARGFSVTLAGGAAEAERVVNNVAVEAVLIESGLPDASPEDLRGRIKQLRPDCQVSILTSFELIRNTPEQMRYGADDWLLRGDQLFDLLAGTSERETSTDSFADRGCASLIQVVDVLVGLRELEDRFFGGSSHQVMNLVRSVAEELTKEPQTVQEVILATLLRDIGKTAVDKAEDIDGGGEPTKKREAVLASLRLLEHIDFPWKILPIIRHHHERYDGTGYPDGLSGREIPMGARIVAVVDAWISMTSPREHRGALEPEQALRELISASGRQFDPEVVEVFQRVLDQSSGSHLSKRRPTILVVEPEPEFRRLMRMRLLNAGYEVKDTTDNERALGMILKLLPDLVLADIDRDPTETFQMLGELRQDAKLCRVPMVFLSHADDRVVKLRALRAGVDEFLSKRQDLEEIVAHVDNIVVRERIRREGAAGRQRKGIQGDLSQLGLPDLVQTLVIGMKTACISLTSRGREGRIWFENGSPRHAEAPDGLEGENAFYELLRWVDGEFVIEHGIRAKVMSVDQDATFLLMEGLRRIDESARSEPAAS